MFETPRDLDRHRAALVGHCYRMLGSNGDAEDAVQETFIRALRGLSGFDGRSSLRTWLYRIATNVCLDSLSARNRRERPVDTGAAGTVEDALVSRPRTHWLEPVADGSALPEDVGPSETAILRQSIRLAFVAALQHLPARQRAVLLLKDVLGFSAAEIAETLETSSASVNSALQRARATLASRDIDSSSAPEPEALSAVQTQLLERYVDAFHRYDIDALVTLMHEDATMSMPPYSLWLQGRRAIGQWLGGRGIGCKGSVLVPTKAAASPSFAQYRPGQEGGPPRAWSLVVLELSDHQITSMTHFLDTEFLYPRFGLPLELPVAKA